MWMDVDASVDTGRCGVVSQGCPCGEEKGLGKKNGFRSMGGGEVR